MSISEKLVDYCISLQYASLPAEVVDKTKYLFLDYLGLAARGSAFDSSKPVISLVKKLGAGGSSRVAGTDLQVKPEYACLANGCFSHSLELDDVINEASLHPAVAVFPAAVAACEMEGKGGKNFIEAAVAGYEVMARLGRAINPSEHYRRGFHPTGTCGTFAAAATAAKIFGLEKEAFRSALGIAGSQAAASMEFLEDGAWTKRFHPGWAAHSGLLAALLAREGFQGTKKPLEGKYGFFNSYSDKPQPELATENLGQDYYLLRTSTKPHACCRYNQSPIDAILSLVKNRDLQPEQVKKVSVALVKTAMPIVAEPAETKRRPQTVVDAQFSMPFAAAVAITKQRAFLDEYSLEVIQSEEIKKLMEKVECYNDPELDKEFPRKWPCHVTIETVQGEKLEAKVEYPKGDPENPLTWDELIYKFENVTRPVWDTKQQQELIDQVKSLETLEDLHLEY